MILVVYLGHGICHLVHGSFNFLHNQFLGSETLRRTCLHLLRQGTSEKKWSASIVARAPGGGGTGTGCAGCIVDGWKGQFEVKDTHTVLV